MTSPDELFQKSEYDKTREHPEYHETVRTADWLRGEIHQGRNVTYVQCPFPGLVFTHFPGESASGSEGHFGKRMGVLPGVHDFLFWWIGKNSGFIEMKAEGRKPKVGQRNFDSKLASFGFNFRAVCYTTEEVEQTLIRWGIAYVPGCPIPPRKPTMQNKRNFALEMLRP